MRLFLTIKLLRFVRENISFIALSDNSLVQKDKRGDVISRNRLSDFDLKVMLSFFSIIWKSSFSRLKLGDFFSRLTPKAQCYETFYSCNLQLILIG
jgi:hypothetical protein